jgi:hypothetical protein
VYTCGAGRLGCGYDGHETKCKMMRIFGDGIKP